jgi:hypothetical protein
MVQHARRRQPHHCESFKLFIVKSKCVTICAKEAQKKYYSNMVLLQTSGIGEPSLHHALVVIFLEFFAWGLLTMPVISVSILKLRNAC